MQPIDPTKPHFTLGPPLSIAAAESIVREHYGIEGSAERLSGECDENFVLRTGRGGGYVLKVAGATEAAGVASLQIEVLQHLALTAPDLPCPRLKRTQDDRSHVRVETELRRPRIAFLSTFLPGKQLLSSTRSAAQRAACGRLLARLGRALRTFEHPAAHRELVWDLRRLTTLQPLAARLPALQSRQFITTFLEEFASRISPRVSALRRQFIHNDFNSRNVLVDPADESHISGIVDFGDSVHTTLVADVAVGVTGQLATPHGAEDAIRAFVGAYCEIEPLTIEELSVLDWLIAGRIVQNVVMTTWYRASDPGNTHFTGFDASWFEWRLALAQQLVSAATRSN